MPWEKQFVDLGGSTFLEQYLFSLEFFVEQPSKHHALSERVLLFFGGRGNGSQLSGVLRKERDPPRDDGRLVLSPIALGATHLSLHCKGMEAKRGTPSVNRKPPEYNPLSG